MPETTGRQIEEPSTLIRIASMARAMLAEALAFRAANRPGRTGRRLEGLFNATAAAGVATEMIPDEVLIAVADLPGQYLYQAQSDVTSSGMENQRRLSKCSVAQSRLCGRNSKDPNSANRRLASAMSAVKPASGAVRRRSG